jgi:hypothetical protein
VYIRLHTSFVKTNAYAVAGTIAYWLSLDSLDEEWAERSVAADVKAYLKSDDGSRVRVEGTGEDDGYRLVWNGYSG